MTVSSELEMLILMSRISNVWLYFLEKCTLLGTRKHAKEDSGGFTEAVLKSVNVVNDLKVQQEDGHLVCGQAIQWTVL